MGRGIGPIEARIMYTIEHSGYDDYIDYMHRTIQNNGVIHCSYKWSNEDYILLNEKIKRNNKIKELEKEEQERIEEVNRKKEKRRLEQEERRKEAERKALHTKVEISRKLKEKSLNIIEEKIKQKTLLERNIINKWDEILNSGPFAIKNLIQTLNNIFYSDRNDNFNIIFNKFIKDKEIIIDRVIPPDDTINLINNLYYQLNKEYLNIEKIETIIETCKKYSKPGYGQGRNVYNEYWTYGITYSVINTDIYIRIQTNDVIILIEDHIRRYKDRFNLSYDLNGNLYFLENINNNKYYNILDDIKLDYLIERM